MTKTSNKIMEVDRLRRLTCVRCGAVKETYSEMICSQGEIVCEDCKKLSEESDKRAYDNWATRAR